MAILQLFKDRALLWGNCELPAVINNNGDFIETDKTYVLGMVTIQKAENLVIDDMRTP
jgi:hypothetical protein